MEILERDACERPREDLLQTRMKNFHVERLRPTTFSQSRLCDSWNAEVAPPCERRAEVARVDLALVEPVPELVQAGEDATEVVGEEPRGEPDVVVRERDGERVDGVVEAPGLVVHPPRPKHLEREGTLTLNVVITEETRVVDRLAEPSNHLHEPVAEPVEDDLDLGGLHAGLVIVEHRVVRIVVRLVAGDVLASWSSSIRSRCGRKIS